MFSLPKILVLLLIIGIVWWGFKLFTRNASEEHDRIPRRRRGKSVEEETVNMERCNVCGDYVPKEGAVNCGDDDCPY